MLDTIDSANPVPEIAAVAAESHTEQALGDEIASLWSAHVEAKNAARATNEELRKIRTKLGEQLCRMKEVLAKPGRGGQWSSFLKERQIPRATADRLVERYQRSLNPDANRLSEAISEPTEGEVQTVFNSVWPKLRGVLGTPSSLYHFVAVLTSHYECSEATDRGILVLRPAAPTIRSASSDGEPIIEPELGSAPVSRADEEVI